MSPRHKQFNPSTIKSSVIRLCVTKSEAEMFRVKANEYGCKSISEYIRMRCIGDEGVDSSDSSSGVDKTAVTKAKK